MKKKTNHTLIILFLHILFCNMLYAQINTSLPVGAIPGAVDVSPAGAATYTIPIEVVPGTQGMQPNLSIVYNSMGGMGLLGMKWNLAGLSAITRCGQIPYFDNNITAVQFSAQDRFALNGERLVKISGNYGDVGATYATEVENFTRVVSCGGSTGAPLYFVAYTDEGNVIEYGYTTDSKQKLGSNNNTILSWYVNKITDVDGNYMTFHYAPATSNEILIDSIKYTGNAGIRPYAKVVFTYTDLPEKLGKNTYFINGYCITQSKLLQTVSTCYNNSILRKYHFNFNFTDAGEHSVHLKEVVLFGEDGTQQLNSTKIKWGLNNYTLTQDPLWGLPSNFPAGKILTGDFDGDGCMDLVVYDINSQGNGWNLYIYNPVSYQYELKKTYNTSYAPNMIYAVDVNRDGKDEIIIATKHQAGTYYYQFVFCSYNKDNNTLNQIGSDSAGDYITHCFGDFDGDGKIDILFASRFKNNKIYDWTIKFKSFGTTHLPGFYFSGPEHIQVQTLNVNGNGKSNFIVKDREKSSSSIYEFNGSNFEDIFPVSNYSPYGGGIIKYGSSCNKNENVNPFFGDINGDGMTESLRFSGNSVLGYRWRLTIAGGAKTFFTRTIEALDTTPANFSVCDPTSLMFIPKHKVMIADINGDGKDDIVQGVYNQSFNSTTFKILLSRGIVDGEYKFIDLSINVGGKHDAVEGWSIGDRYGNGIPALILKDTTNLSHPPQVIRFIYHNDYGFVQEIEDGMRKVIKINYLHKYRYDYYAMKKYFFSTPETIKISNGLGGLSTMQYDFSEPAYSMLKKSFMGFLYFTSINSVNNMKEVTAFSVEKQMLIPFKQFSYLGNTKISEKRFDNVIYSLSGTRFIFQYQINDEFDFITKSGVKTLNYVSNHGRLIRSIIKTYNEYDQDPTGQISLTSEKWIHKETKEYFYKGLCVTNELKKTVPEKVITTQQYGSKGVEISDTLTYSYSGTHLAWMRQENADGAITTHYNNYTTAGLYQQKGVSAPGCTTRTETFGYDPTQRFVKEIVNPLNHSATYTYDPKTGNKTKEVNANDLTTTCTYNKFGNLTKITHSDGTITKDTVYWYSGTNPPYAKYCTKTTSSGKADLIVYYDILGREVCRLEDGYYFDTHYNDKGQVTQTSYPYASYLNKIWNKFTYDVYGRDSTKTAPYTDLTYAYNLKKTTVTDNLRGVSSYKICDALGRITQAVDSGGAINYTYTITPYGRHQTVISTNGATTTIVSDLWGNRLYIIEPNAGLIKSEYNQFNEMIKQIDARGNTTTYEYDILGRITKKKYTTTDYVIAPQVITFFYDNSTPTNKGLGKLHQIKIDNTLSETFLYDSQGRLAKHTKKLNGSQSFSYSYNANGQLQKLTYPSGFAVTYSYTPTGKLDEIKRGSDNSLIYKVNSRNQYHQPLNCQYGNGLVINYDYNQYGLITGIKSTALNYSYGYDTRGMMNLRQENSADRKETFIYDNLDRLTDYTFGPIRPGATTTQTFSYAPNGNITSNSLLGTYDYNIPKPHAVTNIIPVNNGVFTAKNCEVEYNFFNQPTLITDEASATLSHQLELFYGANQQRNQAVLKQNGVTKSNRYYLNKYCEFEPISSREAIYYNYIYGDNGIVALHVGNNQTMIKDTLVSGGEFESDDPQRSVIIDTMYYIHTDHLGSYCAITDKNKTVRQRNFFDPWGNTITTPNFSITARGFTGHEHYPQFKIINMNGRLYDPVIGRFFSPDKYVANGSFTQDFNRYSYARNNPLMYTDPSGELLWFAPLIAVAVGAAISAVSYTVSVATSPGKFDNWDWGQFAFNAMFGAISGAFSCGIGAAVGTGLSVAAGISGFWGGAISGGVAGLVTGTMSGVVNYSISGNQSAIWKSALIGMGTGAVVGGIMGGCMATKEGKTFWKGWKHTIEEASSDIPLVGQNETNNCGPAAVEAVDRKLGGSLTQNKVRGWYPRSNSKRLELPQLDSDKLWSDYSSKTGHGLEYCAPSDGEYSNMISNMKNGDIIALNLKKHHTVVMNQAIRETLVKSNGKVVYDCFSFKVMDPANAGSYQSIYWYDIDNALGIYYIRP